jgi:hypothetical protein
MELIEIKCGNCGKKIYVYDVYAREKMYCTLRCLDSTNNPDYQ